MRPSDPREKCRKQKRGRRGSPARCRCLEPHRRCSPPPRTLPPPQSSAPMCRSRCMLPQGRHPATQGMSVGPGNKSQPVLRARFSGIDLTSCRQERRAAKTLPLISMDRISCTSARLATKPMMFRRTATLSEYSCRIAGCELGKGQGEPP